MNLYIQIENGSPINHPALMDNLISAFGAVPSNWEQFIRIEKPVPTVYQILDSQEPTYKFNEQLGYWMDTWALRDMTDVEKTAKQQAIKDAWAAKPNAANFLAWIFNEDTCQYEPPISRPEGDFKWDGATNSWVEITPPVQG